MPRQRRHALVKPCISESEATCRFIEFDLSLKVSRHVVAEVADAVLFEVLDLGEYGVRDGVSSAVHRLQVRLTHLAAGVLLRLRRHLLHLRHRRLQTNSRVGKVIIIIVNENY